MLSELVHVALLQNRIFSHWLGANAGPEFPTATTAAPLWAERARQNVDAALEGREGFLVPYDVRPAQAFGERLAGIPEAMV